MRRVLLQLPNDACLVLQTLCRSQVNLDELNLAAFGHAFRVTEERKVAEIQADGAMVQLGAVFRCPQSDHDRLFVCVHGRHNGEVNDSLLV